MCEWVSVVIGWVRWHGRFRWVLLVPYVVGGVSLIVSFLPTLWYKGCVGKSLGQFLNGFWYLVSVVVLSC